MRNTETSTTKTVPDDTGLCQMINAARLDERKNCTFSFSNRLLQMALQIAQEDMRGGEAVELLRRESEIYEAEAKEVGSNG
ncbi:DUF2732 domain-containing protein [Salmonella enterica subsp. enterica serovar Bere]|nr:DUF2732 domain-containing protein [Salmonella enterica subsp. enterica serovar Bere]ECE0997119.1 DUF2732 domain-containing protein [Salmonella enterica subsp. enterica serovar Bere]EDT7274180.1 DUF2732 domain-containing protein [Salmonella enterica subsp. enterica serovar Bere]